MNTTNETVIKENKSALQSLKMNPFSFTQKSGSLNYAVYGLIVPFLIIVAAVATKNSQAMVGAALIAGVMALATIVRRGMDAGIPALQTIAVLFLSSWLISVLLEQTILAAYIITFSGNVYVGMVLLAVIENFFLVYLLFAPHKELKVKQTNKIVSILLIGITAIFVLGILAAVVLPRLQ
jgi:hypothetical protein